MKAVVNSIPGVGIPVYTPAGDGKKTTDTKLTFGKLVYKGQGSNSAITCYTPEGVQKLGPLKFVKLAECTSTRPRNVIYICGTGQSVAGMRFSLS